MKKSTDQIHLLHSNYFLRKNYAIDTKYTAVWRKFETEALSWSVNIEPKWDSNNDVASNFPITKLAVLSVTSTYQVLGFRLWISAVLGTLECRLATLIPRYPLALTRSGDAWWGSIYWSKCLFERANWTLQPYKVINLGMGNW